MSKDERKWEKDQRRWEIEHLSDEEWANRHSPSGAAIVIPLVFLVMVGLGVGVWYFLKWWVGH